MLHRLKSYPGSGPTRKTSAAAVRVTELVMFPITKKKDEVKKKEAAVQSTDLRELEEALVTGGLHWGSHSQVPSKR